MQALPGKARLRPWVLAGRRVRRGELRLADFAYGQPSFSQFGEDRVLEQIFSDQDEGFFVDVGAFAPVHISNTYLLYRRGWRGINLEPNPGAIAEFRRLRPRDISLPVAVSEIDGDVDYLVKGTFSGIADARHQWGQDGDRVLVRSRRLESILDEHLPAGQPVDLLDVDCEGHDLVVLQSNNWDKCRPRVVLAEWHEGEHVRDYLASKGYRLYAQLRMTGIYLDAGDPLCAAA